MSIIHTLIFFVKEKNTKEAFTQIAIIKEAASMDQYFKSYEELNVHQLMLSDKARTLSYKNAIMNSKHIFDDKVVMDVGAGTGILSIFCAQAGAKKVYAVEASDLVKLTEGVSQENKLSDKITSGWAFI